MMHRTKLAAVALAAFLAAAPAWAQQNVPNCWNDGMMGQGMMGQGMMGQGQGMMGQGMMGQGMMGQGMMGQGMGPGRFVEGRIAFLEAEIAPTQDQRPLFDAYADALRDQAGAMQAMHQAMTDRSAVSTYPERLAWMQDAMAARLAGMEALSAAAGPLYEALDDRQKAVFDQLMGMM